VGRLLAELMTEPGLRNVVLVSHGDTIRIAAGWLADTAPAGEFDWPALELANGSITTAELVGGVLVSLTTVVPSLD